MLNYIEKWCVKTLYYLEFQRFGRIQKKKKRIIFNWDGIPLFRMFTNKKNYVLGILISLCGYEVYEEKLNLWKPYKRKINHTWGEWQDIIRSYNKRAIPPLVRSDWDSQAS